MNKKGDIPTTVLLVLTFVMCIVVLLSFVQFRANFSDQSMELNDLMIEVNFNYLYIKSEAKSIGLEVLDSDKCPPSLFKKCFMDFASLRDPGYFGQGNFYSKVRFRDFEFSEQGELRINDLFVKSKRSDNEVKRDFYIAIDFLDSAPSVVRGIVPNSKIDQDIFQISQGEVFYLMAEEEHSLTLLDVGSDYVDLIIESEPIQIRLNKDETKSQKLDDRNEISLNLKEIDLDNKKAKLDVKLTSTSNGGFSGIRKISEVDLSQSGKTNVGWDDYKIISVEDTNNVLETYGVDGCIAVIIPMPDKDKVAMAHIHWNGENVDAIMNNMLYDLKEDIDGRRKAILIGGYTQKSEIVMDKIRSKLKESCVDVVGMKDEIMDNKVRNVFYDSARDIMQIHSSEQSDLVTRTYELFGTRKDECQFEVGEKQQIKPVESGCN